MAKPTNLPCHAPRQAMFPLEASSQARLATKGQWTEVLKTVVVATQSLYGRSIAAIAVIYKDHASALGI